MKNIFKPKVHKCHFVTNELAWKLEDSIEKYKKIGLYNIKMNENDPNDKQQSFTVLWEMNLHGYEWIKKLIDGGMEEHISLVGFESMDEERLAKEINKDYDIFLDELNKIADSIVVDVARRPR